MPVAGTRIGPYEVVAPIGKGGMGEVWRARDVNLDRDVGSLCTLLDLPLQIADGLAAAHSAGILTAISSPTTSS